MGSRLGPDGFPVDGGPLGQRGWRWLAAVLANERLLRHDEVPADWPDEAPATPEEEETLF